MSSICEPYPVEDYRVIVAPDEHYSVDNILRLKFIALGFGSIWVFAPIQIIYRLWDLVSGGFITRGSDNGIAWELTKDIGRIAFAPLYLAALFVCCVVGIFFPETGRRLFSRVDRLFYLDPVDPYAPASCLDYYGNVAATCMQTKQFKEEANFNRFHEKRKNYHPLSSQTLLHRLKKLAQKIPEHTEIQTAIDDLYDLQCNEHEAEDLWNGIARPYKFRNKIRLAIDHLEKGDLQQCADTLKQTKQVQEYLDKPFIIRV